MFGLTRWTSVKLAVVAMIPPSAAADASGMFAPQRIGRWHLGGGLGGFKEESNSQLCNQEGLLGGFFSGGYRVTPYIAGEIDGLFANKRIDTPRQQSLRRADARA